jgi:hypothetical protein
MRAMRSSAFRAALQYAECGLCALVDPERIAAAEKRAAAASAAASSPAAAGSSSPAAAGGPGSAAAAGDAKADAKTAKVAAGDAKGDSKQPRPLSDEDEDSSEADSASAFLRSSALQLDYDSLLDEGVWSAHYPLCMALCRLTAELQYLSVNFAAGHALCEHACKRARSAFDAGRVVVLNARQQALRSNYVVCRSSFFCRS